ncbi:aspartate aminotransferase [bacterium BMS3Abin05]|nr:aspartate aminotransferase [bacterium BMS3Abin05]GBE27416.1 aspartate aminotransferase [bacterium BMS3Bbin03]HDL78044.1 pyridoxal phosphate-dependent aminotransferase [Bacteroidota bacterium]HDZ12642.1 pyridoxal phosphate-dependent aminotransferase [Bacteroidota bacterium]
MKLADRMARLGTETAFEVLAKAKALEAQGRDIVHLEIGEPDFDTPAHIREATKKAIDEGYTHYGPAPGIPELRKAIAESIGAARNITVNSDQVVVTLGAKPIIFFSILALAQAGDEVIYPDPGFPIYESVINFTGARQVPIPLREEKEFRFDVDELRPLINDRTKMIILNSPHNPTGGMLSPSDLEAVAEMVRGRDIVILSDEVYEFILYENKFHSIASLPGMQEKTIILHGFSKTYAMTGWRLGFGVMPEWLAECITQLQVNSNSCPNSFIQYGGIAAIKGPQDESRKMVAEFKRRRDVIVDGLNHLDGVSCLTPGGAFYVFPNIKDLIKQTGKDTKELAEYFLKEAGIAVLSGTAFGEYGEGYLRLSYANSVENIQKAVQRMDEAIRKL